MNVHVKNELQSFAKLSCYPSLQHACRIVGEKDLQET